MSTATLLPGQTDPRPEILPDPRPEGRPEAAPERRPRLRRLPVPQTEPAAAQRISLHPEGGEAPAAQGRLELPVGSGAPGPRTLLVDTDVPEPSIPLPDPRAWVATFVQAAVEVAAATRPPAQLVRWTTLDVHAMLVRRSALAARFDRAGSNRRRAVVRTVIVCRPAPDVCEASAVVADGERVRAVALRAEALDDRWRVCALEIG